MSETFAEATARLRRETKLSQEIEELAGFVDMARGNPGLKFLFSGPRLAVLIDQLRELRGRRLAMGHRPDDEVSALAQLMSCERCGRPATCQGQQERAGSSGACCDEHCAHDHAAGCEPLASPVAEEARAGGSREEADPSTGVFCAQCNDLGRTDDENADGGYCDCIAGRTEAGLDAAEEAMARLTPYGEGPTATRSGPLLRCGLYRAELCPVAAGGGHVDCLACEPLSEEPELGCTGLTARWCPRCGDCTCTAEPWNDQDLNEPDCPLHGTASDHAEAPPDPEAIAQRILGKLGPELAAAVCVQLLGRLQRREP